MDKPVITPGVFSLLKRLSALTMRRLGCHHNEAAPWYMFTRNITTMKLFPSTSDFQNIAPLAFFSKIPRNFFKVVTLPVVCIAFLANPLNAVAQTKIVPPDLTPAQRASVLLEPEYSDAMYGNVDRLYLHGYWKFKEVLNTVYLKGSRVTAVEPKITTIPESDIGIKEGYFKPGFNANDWSEMPVPWVWNLLVGEKAGKMTAFAGTGYYRTTFTIPADKAGKKVILHFDSVHTECTIWLNGKQVGQHNNATYPRRLNFLGRKIWMDQFDVDITQEALTGQNNTLVLRVFNSGFPIEWNAAYDGGIIGPVYIDFRESIDMNNILVVASPEDGSLTLQTRVVNSGNTAITLPLSLQVEPFKSKSYTPPVNAVAATVQLGSVSIPKGESEQRFSCKVPGIIPWDINTPALYLVKITDGKRTLGQVRVGFRTMKVEGKQFMLNGHPVNLRGLQTETWGGFQKILPFNKADSMREGIKLLKAAGFNSWRDNGEWQPQHLTPVVLDIFDELGFIVQTDFAPKMLTLDAADAKAEYLTMLNPAGLLSEDGKELSPSCQSNVLLWLNYVHNHPSVCLLTGGNEIGFSKDGPEKPMADYLTAFYKFVKKHDLQKRPTTSSAGLVIYNNWKTPVPADYYDYHCYPEDTQPYLDYTTVNRDAVFRRLAPIYGGIEKPVILGESFGFTDRNLRPDIVALVTNGIVDKAGYCKQFNDAGLKAATNYWDGQARYTYIAQSGIRGAASREALTKTTARIGSEYIRRLRHDTDFHAGFMTTRIDFTLWGLQPRTSYYTSEISRSQALQAQSNVTFVAEKQAFAPLAVIPDLHDRHRFSGESLEIDVIVINEQYATREASLMVEVSIENAAGKPIAVAKAMYENVGENARINKVLKLAIPEKTPTGDYLVHTRLFRNTTVVNETISELYIQEPRSGKVKATLSAGLYETGTGDTSTAKVLQQLSIPFTRITTMNKLDSINVLIIGVDSIDETLKKESVMLRNWIEKGGRVVCFEQSSTGAIPFLPGAEFRPSGNMLFADIIDTKSGVVAGLSEKHFDVWNGECKKSPGAVSAEGKAIYKTLVYPLTEGVVLAGGNRSWGQRFFGIVAGDIALGKGSVFFSQALATSRFGTDPVATTYLQNVLSYTLGALPQLPDGAAIPKNTPVSKPSGLAATNKNVYELVIDNDSKDVAVNGDWKKDKLYSKRIGEDYLHDRKTDKGGKSVEYNPLLPRDGKYKVYLYWAKYENRATRVPVDVVTKSDTKRVYVDQKNTGDSWVLIGEFELKKSGSKVIYRTEGTNDGFVMADAVKFVGSEQ